MHEQPHTIAIVIDAAADVPRVERDGAVEWRVLTCQLEQGGRQIVDDGEPSRTLTAAALDQTALVVEPDPAAWADAFASLAHADRIYSVHAAASFSDGVTHAREAADADPRICVVETRAAGIAAGLVATLIARRVAAATATPDAAPLTLADLDTYALALASTVHLFVVPDHFDPRASQRAVAARVLQGRPMLTLSDGQLIPGGRLRSRRATVAAIERYVDANAPRDGHLHLAVGHADAAGAVDPFLDIIERLRPRATVELVGRVGPEIVGGVGARCVALAWVQEPMG